MSAKQRLREAGQAGGHECASTRSLPSAPQERGLRRRGGACVALRCIVAALPREECAWACECVNVRKGKEEYSSVGMGTGA